MPRVQKDIRQEIISLRHNQYFLALLVLLFVSIIVWTSVSIVTSQKESKVSPKLQQLAKPLTPTISTEVIDELENKRVYSAEDLAAFPIYKIVVSQDGRDKRVVTLDTPEEEIDSFRSRSRTPTVPTPTPRSQPTATASASTPNSPGDNTATASAQLDQTTGENSL